MAPLIGLNRDLLQKGSPKFPMLILLKLSVLLLNNIIIFIIILIVSSHWVIKHLPAQNAFMAIQKETIYIEQPPRFTDSSRPSHVCSFTSPSTDLNKFHKLSLSALPMLSLSWVFNLVVLIHICLFYINNILLYLF